MLTTAYAASPTMVKDIKLRLFDLETGFVRTADDYLVWKNEPSRRVDTFIFDKAFNDLMSAFDYCGYRSVATKLQTGRSVRCKDGEAWLITPSSVKAVAKSIENLSEKGLYQKWEAVRKKHEAQGYDIGSLDNLMLPHIESMKAFFADTAAEGNYVIISQSL